MIDAMLIVRYMLACVWV